MVAIEVRRASAPAGPDSTAERPVADAVNDAFRRIIRVGGHRCPLRLVARQAVADAVAAEALRAQFPKEIPRLQRPWRTAVRARSQLECPRPEAEQVALRMLPTWRLRWRICRPWRGCSPRPPSYDREVAPSLAMRTS